MDSRFYTPQPVARRLVRLVVEAAGGSLPRGAVLEPSVGAGALLLAWLDHAAGPASDPAATARAASLLRTGVWAFDVDPAAVAATRQALAARAAPHLRSSEPCLGRVTLGDGWSGAGEPVAVILANPPWASFSGRQARPVDGAPRAPDEGERGGRWPAYHTRAALGVLGRLRPDGVAGFVLPGQVATLGGYGAFRRALGARVRIVEHLGEGVFPGVESPACLVVVAGGATSAPLQVRLEGREVAIPRAALLAEPARPWLPRLEDRFPCWPPPGFRLVPDAFTDLGLHSGNAARALFSRRPSPGAQPVLEGRDVTPFRVAEPRLWFDPGVRPGPGQYFRIAHWQRTREVPILVRQTASRPIAALNPGLPFRNSVLGCRGVPGLSPHAVVALLNSDVLAAVLRALSPDARQRAFPQLKIGALRRLPWPVAPNPRLAGALDRLSRILGDGPGDGEACARHELEALLGEVYQTVLAHV